MDVHVTSSIHLLIGSFFNINPISTAIQWPKVSIKSFITPIQGRHGLLLLENSLSPTEAENFIVAAERVGFQHQGSRGAAFGEAFRENGRISFNDPVLAQHLWTATGLENIKHLLTTEEVKGGGRGGKRRQIQAVPVGLNPAIRIYRYAKGQRFGRHIDESAIISENKYTEYTVLIYLSSCGGGETVFYNNRGKVLASVVPQPGLMLLHRHGDVCLEHEGAKVVAGTKYVLRSDVVCEMVER